MISLPIVYLIELQSGSKKHLAIKFHPNKEVLSILKQFTKLRYNDAHRVWTLPFDVDLYMEVIAKLEGRAKVIISRDPLKDLKTTDFVTPTTEVLDNFVQFMRSRRYSPKTIVGYRSLLDAVAGHIHPKPIDQLHISDLLDFNSTYVLERNLSLSYQRQLVSAVKLLASFHRMPLLNIDQLERPRRSRQLPTVFSENEVKTLFRKTYNLKHQTIIMMIYSSGLRVSEALNIRLNDIDSDRMIIHIRQAKGNKDRIVPLSVKILEQIRSYYHAYKPRYYLFEGQNGKYSTRSVQQFLKKSLERAGIKRKATVHTLRHSYATHLLESGTDLRYIQTVLGHKSSKTTEIYTHVTQNRINMIESPLDRMDL